MIEIQFTFVIKYWITAISEPALELYSRAMLIVGGIITTQWVLTQGEIPEEGRKKILREIRTPKEQKNA